MSRLHRLSFIVAAILLTSAGLVRAESIRVATWNIENWHSNFAGHRLQATTRAATEPVPDEMLEIVRQERYQNNEDNWEIAQVILDPAFDADVLVVQEGARQDDLEFFNRRWLEGRYGTVLQFPSNTGRDQHLNILLKPGFRIVARRDQYFRETDEVPNPYGHFRFARGPAFALVQSPAGYRFWVGTTHQKSKSGNSVAVTQWRNREAVRTNQIVRELEAEGPADVILLGDFNDELGLQEFEAEGGGDTIANMLGRREHGLTLVTEPLVGTGVHTYGGYWRARYRSIIDHAIVTRSMRDQVEDVEVMMTPLAAVASDHYPVIVTIRANKAPNAARPASAGRQR